MRAIVDAAGLAVMMFAAASPAWASLPVPVPESGVGLAALAVMAVGYRALRKRIDR